MKLAAALLYWSKPSSSVSLFRVALSFPDQVLWALACLSSYFQPVPLFFLVFPATWILPPWNRISIIGKNAATVWWTSDSTSDLWLPAVGDSGAIWTVSSERGFVARSVSYRYSVKYGWIGLFLRRFVLLTMQWKEAVSFEDLWASFACCLVEWKTPGDWYSRAERTVDDRK